MLNNILVLINIAFEIISSDYLTLDSLEGWMTKKGTNNTF